MGTSLCAASALEASFAVRPSSALARRLRSAAAAAASAWVSSTRSMARSEVACARAASAASVRSRNSVAARARSHHGARRITVASAASRPVACAASSVEAPSKGQRGESMTSLVDPPARTGKVETPSVMPLRVARVVHEPVVARGVAGGVMSGVSLAPCCSNRGRREPSSGVGHSDRAGSKRHGAAWSSMEQHGAA